MLGYPDRCQHIKVNGVQCGSPALRRNRFCFFHKRFQAESIRLSADRRRRGTATFILPVLEDANSIQMAIMQIMQFILTGQIEHKTASLLLYALQTASSNIRATKFEPRVHQVILNPRDAAEIPLNANAWDDADYEDESEEEEEELDEVELAVKDAVERAEVSARYYAKRKIRDREKVRTWNEEHPDSPNEEYIDEDGMVARRPRKPPVSVGAQQARAQVVNAIRENLPELTQVVVDAARREKEEAQGT